MQVAFVDIAYGYDAGRPEGDAALGGTTSAICFLARELVKAGVGCTFFNKTHQPATAHGIEALPLDRLIHVLGEKKFDAIIFCGRWMEPMVRLVRRATEAPLVAWMHESTFNPKLVPVAAAFNAIVFVSAWQQRVNQAFLLPQWKQVVIPNAMNPAAAHMFSAPQEILEAKNQPPVLIYAGNAARGAFHLPPILDRLQLLQKNFAVKIFCNTDPSGHAGQDAKYIGWLKSLPHIVHVGMVGQSELIKEMRSASFLVAPNSWPETSCITMIEAMAAGLSVVTTNRAALPETASGFAHHIAIDDPDHLTRFDMPVPHQAFAECLSEAMKEWGSVEAAQKRSKQVGYFNAHYHWKQRVTPWLSFIETLK